MKSIPLRALFVSLISSILLSMLISVQAEDNDFSGLFATQSEFLKVDDAFKLKTEILDDEIIVKFEIAEAYYLYRSRFDFSAEGASLKPAIIPAGKKKVDEYLGNVEVYYKMLELSIPFVAHQEKFNFIIEYQGCAEAGLCYPPEEKQITLYADKVVAKTVNDNKSSAQDSKKHLQNSVVNQKKKVTTEAFVPEQEKVVNFLVDKSLFEIVAYFVLLGIGLAFTPCVLPMVPILSSIIVGQGKQITSGRAFTLSLVYTQSMAIPYAIMGMLVGAAGGALSNTLQQPAFIVPAAVIFILLSLSMFGFYELQLPRSLQNKLNHFSNNQQGGSYLGAGVMGFISALVVSPCVTVPLAGVLIYITQTGDSVIGGVALYSLAFGMGIPLLMVGVGGHKLLPKSGGWMNGVKAVFGVGMLGMALYITKHLIPGSLYLFAWAVLLIVSAIYMGALSQAETGNQKLTKGLGLVLLVYGVILVLGASMGNSRLLSPLANLTGISVTQTERAATSPDPHSGFVKIKTSPTFAFV